MLLSNFPLKNQNADTSEVNAAFDCVPTALAACLQYTLGRAFDGAAIKDAVYGKGYQGGTAASQYVDYCKQQGADLYAIDGTPAALVGAIKQHLEAGNPLLITEPDPYAKPSLGWSHVVAMCGYDEGQSGTLTCMDPFIARLITLPDAEWQARLEFNQVWLVTKIEEDVPMLQLNDPMGKYFTAVSATNWHCAEKNVDLHDGHLAFFRQYNGVFRLPLLNEFRVSQWPNVAFMVYEGAIVAYDPSRELDHPPTNDACYLIHLDSGPGQSIVAKPLLATLQQQVDTLTTQLNELKAQPTTDTSALQAQLDAYKQAVVSVEAAIGALPK